MGQTVKQLERVAGHLHLETAFERKRCAAHGVSAVTRVSTETAASGDMTKITLDPDPDGTRSGFSDYPPQFFSSLFDLEDSNFWFRSRNRLLKYVFERYVLVRNNRKLRFLEIGCGTGFVLRQLAEFDRLSMFGAELHFQGLRYARQRLPAIAFVQLNALHLPCRQTIDIIGAFDVLEHIENDVGVINEAHACLRDAGVLVLTVPQHAALWSRADVAARHKRRYSRVELSRKLATAGFEIEFVTSFVFTLLPAMLASRLFQACRPRKRSEVTRGLDSYELDLPTIVNSCLELFMRLDEMLISRGLQLPAGGSLLVVARKVSHAGG